MQLFGSGAKSSLWPDIVAPQFIGSGAKSSLWSDIIAPQSIGSGAKSALWPDIVASPFIGSGARSKKNKNRVMTFSPPRFSGNQLNVSQSNHVCMGGWSLPCRHSFTNIQLISTKSWRGGCHYPILVLPKTDVPQGTLKGLTTSYMFLSVCFVNPLKYFLVVSCIWTLSFSLS